MSVGYVRITLITDENLNDVLKNSFKPLIDSLIENGDVESFYFAQHVQHKKICLTIKGNRENIVDRLRNDVLSRVQHYDTYAHPTNGEFKTEIEETFDSDNDAGEIGKYGNKDRWLHGRTMRELASKTALDFISKIGKSNDKEIVSQDLIHWLMQNIGYFTPEEIEICCFFILSRVKRQY